jgi:small-conductance mechanosensitive channel
MRKCKQIQVNLLFTHIKGKRIRVFNNEELTGVVSGWTGMYLILTQIANITFSRTEPDRLLHAQWIKKIEFINTQPTPETNKAPVKGLLSDGNT